MFHRNFFVSVFDIVAIVVLFANLGVAQRPSKVVDPFQIRTVDDSLPDSAKQIFSKQVDVFGSGRCQGKTS